MKLVVALVLATLVAGCMVTTRRSSVAQLPAKYWADCTGSLDVTCERFKYTDPRYNAAMTLAGGP